MRGELNEQLSALVDDELRKEEMDLLLRQLGRSEELRERFGHYCLISDVLQGNLSVAASGDLAERVARALEDEPSYETQRRRRAHTGLFLRPVAGMALAVAGAMAVVTMWPQETQENAAQQQILRPVAAVQGAAVRSLQPIEAIKAPGLVEEIPSAIAETADGQRQWEQLDPQIRQQLTDYLINHSERSATHQMDTALPYMRIIGHEASK
ncbi:MAG TPA: sigma-E factor negative regulatory protein [Nitrococcus sp.]|nr:sigma-E factor negative regulatory protein [Nitrococcus sp.]